MASIQRLPAVSVMTDINFPMKGRKGMVDWARNSEDKVVIPKGLFVSQSAGRQPYRTREEEKKKKKQVGSRSRFTVFYSKITNFLNVQKKCSRYVDRKLGFVGRC